jgi:hypothetical protein
MAGGFSWSLLEAYEETFWQFVIFVLKNLDPDQDTDSPKSLYPDPGRVTRVTTGVGYETLGTVPLGKRFLNTWVDR